MNIEHMKFIIEIAEKGSISKASQELFVSQPYLSRVVKEIEEELALPIFNRTNQGVTLTKEGIEFKKKAEIILEQYRSLHNMEVDQHERKNTFSVTTMHSSLVMESFIHLMTQYADETELEFTIKESDSSTPIQDVAYSEVDLGVVYAIDTDNPTFTEELNRRGLVYETICLFQLCIILGVNHPLLKQERKIDLDGLREYGIIAYKKDQLLTGTADLSMNTLEEFIDLGPTTKRVYINNRALLHNLLTHTDYYFIGTRAAKDQERMFNIASIPIDTVGKDAKVEMGVLYRKDDPLNPIAEQLINILKSNYSE